MPYRSTREFVNLLREDANDPERIGRYQTHALDILLDGLQTARRDFDLELDALDDDERSAYMHDQAQRLAPELLMFIQAYGLQRLESVSAWRRRTRWRR
jgi:hypothetical protein